MNPVPLEGCGVAALPPVALDWVLLTRMAHCMAWGVALGSTPERGNNNVAIGYKHILKTFQSLIELFFHVSERNSTV